VRRGQRETKDFGDDIHQEMCHPNHHRLYCEMAAACECPPVAVGVEVPAYTAASTDWKSYQSACYARRPEEHTEHAHEQPADVVCALIFTQTDFQIYSYMQIIDIGVKYTLLSVPKYSMLLISDVVIIVVLP